MIDSTSPSDNEFGIEERITASDLFPFKPRLPEHIQKLIGYWSGSMDPSLRFVYCSDGSIKFTTTSDENHFKNSVLDLYNLDRKSKDFSTFKIQLETIINHLNVTDKGIPLNDSTIEHAVNDMINKGQFPYYFEPQRIVQQYMNDHIRSMDDIKLIWDFMPKNGFYITEFDEPDEEYRNQYVRNAGIILVLSICERMDYNFSKLQNPRLTKKPDNEGILVDLVISMISAGRTHKSTFCKNLALGYHTDKCRLRADNSRTPETEFFQAGLGMLINELSEIQLTYENIEAFKQYISSKNAFFAEVYEAKTHYPLTSVYVISNNHQDFIPNMEDYGRFLPLFHKLVESPYQHDQDGICTDDYFLRILAEGLFLVRNGQHWKDYYTDQMKQIQKEMAKSISYRSPALDVLLKYLDDEFEKITASGYSSLDDFEKFSDTLLKTEVKDGFFSKYTDYDKKDLKTAWRQLETDMSLTTGRQQYGYYLKRDYDPDNNNAWRIHKKL